MSIHVLSWVLRESPTTGAQRLVLISLADHARDDGSSAWPSVATMQRDARLKSRRSVQSALRNLEEAGAIEQTGRHESGTAIYAVKMGGAKNAPAQSEAGGAQSTTSGGANSAPKPSIDPSEDPSLSLPVPDSTDEVQEVYLHWLACFGYTTIDRKLTDGRRRKVRARLKDCERAKIDEAIRRVAASSWHRRNGHTDLTMILASPEKVDYYAGLPPRDDSNGNGRKSVGRSGQDLRMAAEEARRRGQ